MRREVPLLITGIVGITFVVKYFVPHFPFSRLDAWFSDWFSIVQACAIILGALNLLKISLLKVVNKKDDWGYALVIIASFLLIMIIGGAGGVDFRSPGTPFDWLYQNVYIPLSATMFSILAFFVASASYRAFRARNFEATLLLVAAFFVMIGRVPVGDVISGIYAGGMAPVGLCQLGDELPADRWTESNYDWHRAGSGFDVATCNSRNRARPYWRWRLEWL